MPEYVGQRQSKEEKRRDRAKLLAEFGKGGDFTSTLELGIIGEEAKVEEVLNEWKARAERFEAVQPKRQPNPTENADIERLCRLAKSGDPQASNAGTDLQAYVHRLMGLGVCESAIRAKVARELK